VITGRTRQHSRPTSTGKEPAVAGRRRSTRQAEVIEAALAEADGFRTALDLFAQIRGSGQRIGLTTVYRHLALLAEANRADVVHSPDGEASYRLCGLRDASGPADHHHHLVCRECGRSVEACSPEVEAWADRLTAQTGYTDITLTVELFGLCPQHSPRPPGQANRRSAR
jgi:Fur family transcriptional regulator, ferric uptake regulator